MTDACPPADRRRGVRTPGAALPPTFRLRLRAGHEAAVVNFSRVGILLESTSRLLPGHRCTLRVSGTGEPESVSGRILRAQVERLDSHHGVVYRGAIEFDDMRPTSWVESTHDG